MKSSYYMLYKLSFLTYLLALYASPYISARSWADMSFGLFLIAVVYQLIFIVFLRKEQYVSLGKSISAFFLYSLMACSIYIISIYVEAIINGYTATTFTGEVVAEYYGFDAWENMRFENIVFIPILGVTLIYGLLYYKMSKR